MFPTEGISPSCYPFPSGFSKHFSFQIKNYSQQTKKEKKMNATTSLLGIFLTATLTTAAVSCGAQDSDSNLKQDRNNQEVVLADHALEDNNIEKESDYKEALIFLEKASEESDRARVLLCDGFTKVSQSEAEFNKLCIPFGDTEVDTLAFLEEYETQTNKIKQEKLRKSVLQAEKVTAVFLTALFAVSTSPKFFLNINDIRFMFVEKWTNRSVYSFMAYLSGKTIFQKLFPNALNASANRLEPNFTESGYQFISLVPKSNQSDFIDFLNEIIDKTAVSNEKVD